MIRVLAALCSWSQSDPKVTVDTAIQGGLIDIKRVVNALRHPFPNSATGKRCALKKMGEADGR